MSSLGSVPDSCAAKDAEAPFNTKTADAVLRTSDNVDFHVHTVILAIASPFFTTLFSLADHAPAPTPVVKAEPIMLSEDSETIDALLRYCYPVADPKIAQLEQLDKVLTAALKYQMEEAITILRDLVGTHVTAEPLLVFTIACRLRLEKEAWRAAEVLRKQHQSRASEEGAFASTVQGVCYIPEMKDITAGAYFRLIQYVRQKECVAVTFCDPPLPQQPAPTDAAPPNGASGLDAVWRAEMDLRDTDLILRAQDGTEFPVHRLVMHLSAGALFLAQLDEHQSEKNSRGLPVAFLGIQSNVLLHLLRHCYPFSPELPETQDPDMLVRVLRSAIDHKMSNLVLKLKSIIMRSTNLHPLCLYLVATEFRWSDEAREASKFIIDTNINDLYLPEMEHVSAEAYNRLLKFHHECRLAALKAIAPNLQQWKKLPGPLLACARCQEHTICLPIVEAELHKAAGLAAGYTVDMEKVREKSAKFEEDVKRSLDSIAQVVYKYVLHDSA